jgi:hypothetical protein
LPKRNASAENRKPKLSARDNIWRRKSSAAKPN